MNFETKVCLVEQAEKGYANGLASGDFELAADGIYVKAGIGKEKAALLVVIGVHQDGSKRFLALEPGYRESKELWPMMLITRGQKRQAVCRRRQSGIMGCSWRDLSSLPGAALLES